MTTTVCLVLALLTSSLSMLDAIERKPLPPFLVVSLDGDEIASDALTTEGKWLLVYVQPGCVPCDTLLRAIDADQQSDLSGRTIVIVGGADAAGAARMAAAYHSLTRSRWYGDPKRAMGKTLPLAGAPVMFGLRGNMLEWSRAGLLPDERSVVSALTSWVRTAR